MREPDTPAVARKRERETRTISQMVSLYCAGNHDPHLRTERAECGEAVCEACRELDEYACLRTRRCRRMAEKVSCNLCQNHCYAPAMQERIRQVMRYAGPRMLLKHPVTALRYLAKKVTHA